VDGQQEKKVQEDEKKQPSPFGSGSEKWWGFALCGEVRWELGAAVKGSVVRASA